MSITVAFRIYLSTMGELAVSIPVTLFICPWHGRHCRSKRHCADATRYGWASELASRVEEALTLFESVSFIGQLLFAAVALVLETVGRGRRISGWAALGTLACARQKQKSLVLRFGNGRGWNGRGGKQTMHHS